MNYSSGIRKVLHIAADGAPGGGIINVLALIEDLIGKGMEVHFCSQVDSYALKMATKLGVRCYSENFFRSRLDPSVPRQLKRITRAVDPDILHLHGTRAGFFSSWHMRSGNRPFTVYTIRGYHFFHKNFLLRRLGAISEKRANRYVDVTVFVCQYDQNIAKEYRLLPSSKKGIVICNGIRPNRLPQAGRIIHKSIGFVGRLVHQKNPHLLLDIINELRDEGYTLKIIGGGDLEQEIRKRIRQLNLEAHVTMTGSLSHGEAMNQLKNSEVFLLPSRWEGLPVAPIEAMQIGIPVVLSDNCGNIEIVKDGFNGVTVKGQNPKIYADAIRTICTNSDFRMYLISNARQTVERRFTQDRVTAQYLNLYEKCFQTMYTGRRVQKYRA